MRAQRYGAQHIRFIAEHREHSAVDLTQLVLRTCARLALTTLVPLNVAFAQRAQPELRLDVLGPTPLSIEPGLGLNVPLGTYVRSGLAAGFDVRSETRKAWRGDFITRFTFDPFRQQRWALSLGGGLSFRRQTYLAAIMDLEGPEIHGFMPALQAGVSGGVRAGLILRRAIAGRR